MKLKLISFTLSVALAMPSQGLPKFGAFKIKERAKIGVQGPSFGKPDPEYPLKMMFGLKQRNIDGLLKKLDDISNPYSPNWRNWLSYNDTLKYAMPEESALETVTNWLVSSGFKASDIKNESPGWISVRMSISQAEVLLHTEYALFNSSWQGALVPRTASYSLPDSLHKLIDTVQPTTVLYQSAGQSSSFIEIPMTQRSASIVQRSPALCYGGGVTPECLRAYYDYDWTPSNRNGAQLGVYANGGPANHADARQFYQQSSSNVYSGDFIDVTLDGSPGNPGTTFFEGNLDTQWAGAMAGGNAVYYIYEKGGRGYDPMVSFVNYLNGPDHPPSTVSTSYYGIEDSTDYYSRLCRDLGTASSRGISIFAASGDEGTASYFANHPCPDFSATFPSACPYVTSVGATQFVDNKVFDGYDRKTNHDEQGAAFPNNGGGTGGGFSKYWPQPSWQQKDVQAYVQSLGTYNQGNYNPNGRAYPDIAAMGKNMETVTDGNTIYTGYGTSYSAPMVAGMISVVNDWLVSKGKSPLGFLNPALYQGPLRNAVKDIKSGVTGMKGCSPQLGFPAGNGWDAATGLGTPTVRALRFFLG